MNPYYWYAISEQKAIKFESDNDELRTQVSELQKKNRDSQMEIILLKEEIKRLQESTSSIESKSETRKRDFHELSDGTSNPNPKKPNRFIEVWGLSVEEIKLRITKLGQKPKGRGIKQLSMELKELLMSKEQSDKQ